MTRKELHGSRTCWTRAAPLPKQWTNCLNAITPDWSNSALQHSGADALWMIVAGPRHRYQTMHVLLAREPFAVNTE